MALDELRAEIDTGLRTRRFLGYYESRAWAIEATPVVEAIRQRADRGSLGRAGRAD